MRLYVTNFNNKNDLIVDRVWKHNRFVRLHDTVFIPYRIHVRLDFTSLSYRQKHIGFISKYARFIRKCIGMSDSFYSDIVQTGAAQEKILGGCQVSSCQVGNVYSNSINQRYLTSFQML